MSHRQATDNALEQAVAPGSDRSASQHPLPGSSAPINRGVPNPPHETNTLVEPPSRPTPDVPRPVPSQQKVPSSGLSTEINQLGLLDRFNPEARNLTPALVTPGFQCQAIHDTLYNYFHYRFTDIAYASDSTIAYIAQIDAAAQRVATIAINAIVNKLILGNRADGLPVNNLANPIGPPKGFVHPSVAASVIAAVGKTSPVWSGDQYFLPNLGNAIPNVNDHTGNAIVNIHVFPANPNADMIVARFCASGTIPLRSIDWKVPGGSPLWLTAQDRNNGRVNTLVAPDVHPDNFDPANTLLSTLCSCTAFPVGNTRYVIMKAIAETTIWSLISNAYE